MCYKKNSCDAYVRLPAHIENLAGFGSIKAPMCPTEGTVAPIAVRVQVSNSDLQVATYRVLTPTKALSLRFGLCSVRNARLFRQMAHIGCNEGGAVGTRALRFGLWALLTRLLLKRLQR